MRALPPMLNGCVSISSKMYLSSKISENPDYKAVLMIIIIRSDLFRHLIDQRVSLENVKTVSFWMKICQFMYIDHE